MADQIRTFIAVELDLEQRQALEDLQARFESQLSSRYVRWVAPESMHLTIKFLGGVDSGAMPALERAVASVCERARPFALSIAGVGAFPSARRPNVVWVGLGGAVQAAEQLTESIEAACEALGFARETRPFTAHLTLGRVKRDARPADRQLVGDIVAKASIGKIGSIHVDSVSIMKSDLTPSGSIYTRMAAIGLGGK